MRFHSYIYTFLGQPPKWKQANCCLIAARARAAARVGDRATATSVTDSTTGAGGTGLKSAAAIAAADGRVADGRVSTPSAIATATVATKKRNEKNNFDEKPRGRQYTKKREKDLQEPKGKQICMTRYKKQ